MKNNKNIRIIIAGGRKFNDYALVEKSMNKLFSILSDKGILTNDAKEDIKHIEIISGCAYGADTLGEKFAKDYGIKVVPFPAKWDDLDVQPCVIRTREDGSQYNILAGYNRNTEMANYVSENDAFGILVAFWDGESTGTKNMLDLAVKHDLYIEKIMY